MTKPMLIDTTHAEETRVVVLSGNRLEDFDVETSTRKQLKGNIYLAKVVRVEPSLQAAFVDYGGNRHGFLAFDEIHPDYYQIPIADRERLLAMQAEEAAREQEEEDKRAEQAEVVAEGEDNPSVAMRADHPDAFADSVPAADSEPAAPAAQSLAGEARHTSETGAPFGQAGVIGIEPAVQVAIVAERVDIPELPIASPPAMTQPQPEAGQAPPESTDEGPHEDRIEEASPPETIGGEADMLEESRERRRPSRFLRNYKIQEVIKRRQILLVQVVKEERGTKGAALTTYVSLAGRFCVLMPNSPRGGGISRKITSPADRRRLRDVMVELDLPKGMGLIVRTAGANRPKADIKRDCEYLLRLWDDIREKTLRSVAPALIYEEANLIKRAIRDLYSRDIDEIIVDGEQGWKAAREFMRMLMPSHVKKVQLWRNGGTPLFAHYQVDAQLDAILSPTVQLRSGGYLVINQTEALVAVDVNSGRSTRERNIEETALRTNLEAADEVARQVRLRDLAGLIVIDFIDMETHKHNTMVERRLKEALKADRARIQIGRISHFGLLEMSRQRLRPSLAETSLVVCPHCGGLGHVRSTEGAAIHVLRGIEEEGAKRRAAEIVVHTSPTVVMYILNHKRERLHEIEMRTSMSVLFEPEELPGAAEFRIERVRAWAPAEAAAASLPEPASVSPEPSDEPAEAIAADPESPDVGSASPSSAEAAEEIEHRRRRRRRRRRSSGRREEGAAPEPSIAAAGETVPEAHLEGVPEHAEPRPGADEPGASRRGHRGGRPRRRDHDDEISPLAAPGAEQPELPPLYVGPTPANPFGGRGYDIFDALDLAEQDTAMPPPSVHPAETVGSEPAPQDTAMPPPSVHPTEMVGNEPAPQDTAMPPPSVHPTEMVGNEPPAQERATARSATEPAPNPGAPLLANDEGSEPAVKPILVGAEEEPPIEKKTGWWRR